MVKRAGEEVIGSFLEFSSCFCALPCHTEQVIRRATILVLASVLSLCAAQATPLRDAGNQNVPAAIRLAQSRSEKAVKLRIRLPQFSIQGSAHQIVTEPFAEPEAVSSPASPRAPPAFSA